MWKSNRYTTHDGNEIVIRPAYVKDARGFIETLEEVCKEGVYLLHDHAPRTIVEQEKILRKLDYKQNILVVAELNGEIVGGMGIFMGGLSNKAQHYCNLGIHLIKKARSKGIGSRMMLYGIDWANEKGFHKICLSVFAYNIRAISLYRKCGFVEEGLRREQYWVNNRFVDELLMARFL